MAFLLTLLYLTIALLSPVILPPEILSLHVVEIDAVLMVLIGIPLYARSGLLRTPLSWLVAGMVFFTAVSTLATGWLGGVPTTLDLIVPPVFSFFFLVLTCRTLFRIRVVIFVMTAVAFFIFLQGLLAESSGNLSSPYLTMEHGLARYCGLGFLSDPNDLAQMFVALIPLQWVHWKKGNFVGNLLLTLLPAAILLFAIFKTHSRGAVIALIALVLFAFKKKMGIILSSIAAGCMTLAALALNLAGGRGLDEDDGGRIAAWITGLRVFLSHPFFGVGMNNFGNYNETGLTAHNSYVLCLAEIGIFGYFCWLGLLVFSWSGLTQVIGTRAARTAPGIDPVAKDVPAMLFSPATLAGHGDARLAGHAMPNLAVGSLLQSPFARPVSGPPPQASHAAADRSARRPALVMPVNGFDPLAPVPVSTSYPDETYEQFAALFRLGLLGFMVTAFFLSRTYTMVLYALLGLSTALQLIYGRQHPDFTLDRKMLLKRTAFMVLASIVFLYLFVRVRGV